MVAGEQRIAFPLDGRKLEMDERPLWVQLYWGKDQREGRFVLQNAKLPKVRSSAQVCSVEEICVSFS